LLLRTELFLTKGKKVESIGEGEETIGAHAQERNFRKYNFGSVRVVWAAGKGNLIFVF
jgi:hypothetical protein